MNKISLVLDDATIGRFPNTPGFFIETSSLDIEDLLGQLDEEDLEKVKYWIMNEFNLVELEDDEDK